MSERPEIFQTVSSLPDDFDGVIDGAWFGKNPQYNFDGKMPVVLNFNILSDEIDNDEKMEKIIVSIGDGWVAVDNKSRVELEKPRPSGKLGFGDGSNIGKWIDRLFELDEAAVLSHYEETQAGPDDIRFWDGLKAHFNREPTAKQKADGKAGSLIVTAIHGWETAAPAKTKATSKPKGKKKAAARPETNGGAAAAEIDPAVLAQITTIADEAETYDEFIAEVFANVAAAAEEPLYSKVMEGEEVAGSIWAEAIARAE